MPLDDIHFENVYRSQHSRFDARPLRKGATPLPSNIQEQLIRTSLGVVLITISLCGCGEETTYPELIGCTVEDSSGIALITGEQGQAERDAGQTRPLTYGFQGGYHVYAGVTLDEKPAGQLKLSMNLCQGDIVVARGRGEVLPSSDPSGYATDTQLVYVLHGYQASQLHGIDSTLSVLAVDEAGRRWTKQVSVLPRCCN